MLIESGGISYTQYFILISKIHMYLFFWVPILCSDFCEVPWNVCCHWKNCINAYCWSSFQIWSSFLEHSFITLQMIPWCKISYVIKPTRIAVTVHSKWEILSLVIYLVMYYYLTGTEEPQWTVKYWTTINNLYHLPNNSITQL